MGKTIKINKASEQEMMNVIPGIGPVKARDLVEIRKTKKINYQLFRGIYGTEPGRDVIDLIDFEEGASGGEDYDQYDEQETDDDTEIDELADRLESTQFGLSTFPPPPNRPPLQLNTSPLHKYTVPPGFEDNWKQLRRDVEWNMKIQVEEKEKDRARQRADLIEQKKQKDLVKEKKKLEKKKEKEIEKERKLIEKERKKAEKEQRKVEMEKEKRQKIELEEEIEKERKLIEKKKKEGLGPMS